MSQTCKRLRQICGYYFRENFAGLHGFWDYGSRGVNFIVPFDLLHKKNGLNEFIIKGRIEWELNRYLRAESFYSLKELVLFNVKLYVPQMYFIKEILSGVEVLKIENCKINASLGIRLLQHCPQLKRLHVHGLGFKSNIPDAVYDWMWEKYPALEHFELTELAENWEPEEFEIIEFLQKNPNIKHFEIDAQSFCTLGDSFEKSNIHLHCLGIHFNEATEIPIARFFNLLQTLGGLALYKSVFIRITGAPKDITPQELVDGLASFASFEFFHLGPRIQTSLDLSSLAHLKVLCIENHLTMPARILLRLTNMNILAENLVNLEQLYFTYATSNDILPFIQRSTKLHTLGIQSFWKSPHVNDGLDLKTLNEERQMLKNSLSNPVTVTIYVPENVYLATRWKLKSRAFDLVEVKREQKIQFGFGYGFGREYS